jgi:hypothetical protein
MSQEEFVCKLKDSFAAMNSFIAMDGMGYQQADNANGINLRVPK